MSGFSGFGVLGPADGLGAQSASQLIFEFAEQRIAGWRATRVRVETQGGCGPRVVALRRHPLPVNLRQAFVPRVEVKQSGAIHPGHVSAAAGPRIRPRCARHPSAPELSLNVSQGGERASVIHGTRVKSALPQRAAASVQTVDILRMHKVRATNGRVQRVFARRDGDEMNVVGYEAIAPGCAPLTWSTLRATSSSTRCDRHRRRRRPAGHFPAG